MSLNLERIAASVARKLDKDFDSEDSSIIRYVEDGYWKRFELGGTVNQARIREYDGYLGAEDLEEVHEFPASKECWYRELCEFMEDYATDF